MWWAIPMDHQTPHTTHTREVRMSTPDTSTPDIGWRHHSRRELLERSFLHFVRLIETRQGLQHMPPGFLPDYLALGWIVHREGSTELTPAGRRMAQSLLGTRRVRRARSSA
jgi:hypothetical protein